MTSPDPIANLSTRHRVTAAITAACGLLLALGYWWGGGSIEVALMFMGPASGDAIRRGELYRLFSAAFLHADVVHFGCNMVALWSFGTVLESLLGSRRFLLLYAASALGGSVASTMFGSVRWTVGASGAVWGLMTAAIGIALRPRGLLPPLVVSSMRSRAWVPLVLNVAYSFRPNVDLRAHLGGGLVGFLFAVTWLTIGLTPLSERDRSTDADPHPNAIVKLLAAVAGLAMVASVLTAVVLGRAWELSRPPTFQRVGLPDTSLSLEVPSMLAKSHKTEAREHTHVSVFGSLSEAPVVLEVIAVPGAFERALSSEELAAYLDKQLEELDAHPPENAVVGKPAQRAMAGTRPVARIQHEIGGLRLDSFLMVVGTSEVLVRAYSRKNRPEAWSGVEAQVAASVLEN